jgi:Uma2 family endonuclease
MEARKEEYLPYYTVSDYLHWEGKWELIYGIPYAMAPAPIAKHQIINTKIASQLDRAVELCQCLAIVEPEWRIEQSSVVIPDCVVICYEPDNYLNKAPKIIFEVVSQSSVIRDERIKFEIYQNECVEYYVLVYPDLLVAKLYRLKEGRYHKEGDFNDTTYRFDIDGCSLEFDFEAIFKRYQER